MPQTLPMPADTLPTSAHRALAPVIIDGVTTPAPSAHSTTRANNHTDMSHTAMNQFTNHHTGLDHNGLDHTGLDHTLVIPDRAGLDDHAPAANGAIHTATTPAAPPAPAPAPTAPAAFTDADVLAAHLGGKLSIELRAPIADRRDLSMLYTPGVAGVSSLIAREPAAARAYTWASRVVAVISDGTAVLGLGDIGPKAALPVMEGKSALMKAFADLDSVPIVLDTTDPDGIVAAVKAIAPSFGAINLEDISAPRCFEVEQRLTEALDIPVMHDDQHGTAVVVLAALMNAASVIQRVMIDLRVVVAGAGAAGIACAKILHAAGVRDLIVVDSKGVLHPSRENLHPVKAAMAQMTNPRGISGSLADAMAGADVFIGVSGGSVDPALVETMGPQPIIFALANPTPEIDPREAARRGAAVVATGRSDYANQINNVLAFPGIFLGALDCGARRITEGMKVAASGAICAAVPGRASADRIVPDPFTPGLARMVADAVMNAARAEGVAETWPC
jgi:malate dehydrogenase (oxaloacetate-decarboxylating)